MNEADGFIANGNLVKLDDWPVYFHGQIYIEDSSQATFVTVLRAPDEIARADWSLAVAGVTVANSSRHKISIHESLRSELEQVIERIPDGENEIFPHDHLFLPNSGRPRNKDLSTVVRRYIDSIVEQAAFKVPKADHFKIGRKTQDVFRLSEIHVDRFAGMRSSTLRVRRRVFRTFLNVGQVERHVCFSVMDPNLVDELVPDAYSETYLNTLLARLNWNLTLLWVSIPVPTGDTLYSARYLATHNLHCEYGFKGDLCVVLNSDGEAIES